MQTPGLGHRRRRGGATAQWQREPSLLCLHEVPALSLAASASTPGKEAPCLKPWGAAGGQCWLEQWRRREQVQASSPSHFALHLRLSESECLRAQHLEAAKETRTSERALGGGEVTGSGAVEPAPLAVHRSRKEAWMQRQPCVQGCSTGASWRASHSQGTAMLGPCEQRFWRAPQGTSLTGGTPTQQPLRVSFSGSPPWMWHRRFS